MMRVDNKTTRDAFFLAKISKKYDKIYGARQTLKMKKYSQNETFFVPEKLRLKPFCNTLQDPASVRMKYFFC